MDDRSNTVFYSYEGRLHMWTYSGCMSAYNTCTRSSQAKKISAWTAKWLMSSRLHLGSYWLVMAAGVWRVRFLQWCSPYPGSLPLLQQMVLCQALAAVGGICGFKKKHMNLDKKNGWGGCAGRVGWMAMGVGFDLTYVCFCEILTLLKVRI